MASGSVGVWLCAMEGVAAELPDRNLAMSCAAPAEEVRDGLGPVDAGVLEAASHLRYESVLECSCHVGS